MTTQQYVYLQSEPNLYTVGFYTPNNEWIAESDWDIREEAAKRVNYLNGSGNHSEVVLTPVVSIPTNEISELTEAFCVIEKVLHTGLSIDRLDRKELGGVVRVAILEARKAILKLKTMQNDNVPF